VLGGFGWREAPRGDEGALSLFVGCRSSELCAEVYEEWRRLGAPVVAAPIRAGETARERDAQQ
jgi:hypothetical protein